MHKVLSKGALNLKVYKKALLYVLTLSSLD